ncbi:hypothetical protein EKO23_04780 [Nocardioides guangzhouensis]|uniref:BRCT domain-containing protein n=1 Tax=Nocardioides guangzhouensis TaxID=2497878 RepID=A0A4Q4ZHK5_9ACTN|nr:hypothetical protein [Nocardioides guangzhouensis]RYP87712.1 hypothetical protein EKO23_04780 [Nocardioides guangzhouensis]
MDRVGAASCCAPRPWSGRFGPGSKKSARHEQEATFVDAAFVDPGAAPALPDVGILPRAWDGKLTHTGKEYVPAHVVRASHMGARRFYVVDSNGDVSDGLTDFITENGGRMAKNLVRSVAALIVPRPGFASPQTARAAELGIPVITAADFLATPPETWA